jgi:hypothetical protein
MNKKVGYGVPALSAAGYPATRYVVRRFGRTGGAFAELVCARLFLRDGAMIARGTPAVLRKGPAALLWLECGVGAVAAITNARLLTDPRAGDPCPDGLERIRRAAIAALFALHTVRFAIYLRPDQGRRATPPAIAGPATGAGLSRHGTSRH